MRSNRIPTILLAAGLLSGGVASFAAPFPQTTTSNSESADRDATQKIRKAIIGDKSLSTYAHNVKILAHEGKVTLRGPVRSDAEKQTVGEMAASVVGAANVTNELIIQPAK